LSVLPPIWAFSFATGPTETGALGASGGFVAASAHRLDCGHARGPRAAMVDATAASADHVVAACLIVGTGEPAMSVDKETLGVYAARAAQYAVIDPPRPSGARSRVSCASRPGSHILDIGCGPGLQAFHDAKAQGFA
jgi:hypothetical protein